MLDDKDYRGMAALSICESLLLALNDHHILPEAEIIGVLRDAAVTHENATGTETDLIGHTAAAALIHRIIASGNSVRRR